MGVACAERMKGSVLELGGKDPMLVLADANLTSAVSGALWGGFANAGQTCSGIERVYVARDVADRFVEGLVEGAAALRVGDPMDPNTEIGPMVSREQFDLVAELVDDAVDAGAELRCGGPGGGDSLKGVWFSRRCSPASRTRCASCARRSSARCLCDDHRERGRGDRAGQRLGLRAGRVRVDPGPSPRGAHRAPHRVRHGLDQRPHVLPRGVLLLVGRREGLWPRALALEVRLLRVREHQARLLGSRAREELLVASLRRLPGPRHGRLGQAPLRTRCGQARGATARPAAAAEGRPRARCAT